MMKVLSYFVIFFVWLGCAEPQKIRTKTKSDGSSVSEGSTPPAPAPAPALTTPKANLNPAASPAIHTLMESDQALPPGETQDLEPTSDFLASADPSESSTFASQPEDTGSPVTQSPSAGTQNPPTGTQSPPTGTQSPSAGTQSPSAGTQSPSAGTQSPSAGTQSPSAGTQSPSAGTQSPSAGTQPPVAQAPTMPAGPKFISTWRVPQNTQIVLPLLQTGNYNFTVDWGDGSALEVIKAPSANHVFSGAGEYTVTIAGTIQGWSFNNSGSAPLITNISQWGPLSFGDSSAQFLGATNLTITATDAPDISSTTKFSFAFAKCAALTTIPGLENWDMSPVTTMGAMFVEATNFNQNISSWDVGNVLSMQNMFAATKAFNQDLSRWNVSKVQDMGGMFQQSVFDQDIHLWDVSSVTTMSSMFSSSSFNNGGVPLSWGNKTRNLIDISSMFNGAAKFNQKVGDWNVASVRNAAGFAINSGFSVFSYNDLLENWSTKLFDASSAFSKPTLSVSAGYTNKATQARNTIAGKSWTLQDGGLLKSFDSTWSANVGTTITLPLYSGGTYDFIVDWGDGSQQVVTSPLASHRYAVAKDYLVSIVGTIKGWSFYEANGGKWYPTNGNAPFLKNISQWGPLAFGNPRGGQFWGATNLTITATDTPDLSQTTNLGSAFSSCKSLTGVPNMNQWDTKNVQYMQSVFALAAQFNEPIGSWNTSKVTSMGGMFQGASTFNQDISNWDVSNSTSMNGMFQDASSFNQNIGPWNVSKVTDMGSMFLGATNFNKNIKGWDVSAVTNAMYFKYNSPLVTNYTPKFSPNTPILPPPPSP